MSHPAVVPAAVVALLAGAHLLTTGSAPGVVVPDAQESAATDQSEDSAEVVEPTEDGWFAAEAAAGSVVIGGIAVVVEPGAPEPSIVAPLPYEFERMPVAVCLVTREGIDVVEPCLGDPAGTWVGVQCPDGSDALHPLFRRPVDLATGEALGSWEQVDDGGCPGDLADAVVVSVEEFRRLPIAASVPSYQPGSGRGLVNKPLIVYTDPTPQTLTTAVLGVPVTVVASPVQFAWDFGDGSAPLVTDEPGAPYPDQTVSYPYPEEGEFWVQLVTTWQGRYQVNGAGPWYAVSGTATTTSAPFLSQVVEARTHLVQDSLA